MGPNPINFNTTMLIVNGWRNIIYTQKKELFHNGFEDHCTLFLDKDWFVSHLKSKVINKLIQKIEFLS